MSQVGLGRDTEAQRDPRRSNSPGSDRDLGTDQGRQRGERTVTGNGDRHSHVMRGAGTSGRGWRLEGTGNIQLGSASHQ